MYKKITHNIVEEHFDHPSMLPHRLAMTKQENEEDVIQVNVPLMIRLLEWAKEDANKDVDIHIIVERLIELSDDGDILSMSDYPEIVPQESDTGD